MKKQNIRTLSLVVITLTYLIIGAAVFDHFESDNEFQQKMRLNQNISAFKKKYNMNNTEFNRLWKTILEKKPYQAGNQWKFVGSLYFCTVVVTLIGYGHSTPRTIPGKCFCIFYTLIGIPIFLIMFQSVGERLNSLIVFFLTRFKRRLKLKNQQVGLFELISIEFFLTMTITMVASYVFMSHEEWTYFDAMYYCFITLTTIGFGDFVPLQKNNYLSNNFAYACFTILFILIGLTTLASSMNLLVLRLATINAEEAVQERLEAAEARRNAVHLEGDVIQPNTRLFTTQEKPEQVETISVCSCACLDYKIWHQHQPQPLQHPLHNKKMSSASSSDINRGLDTNLRFYTSGRGGGGGGGRIIRREWRLFKRLLPFTSRFNRHRPAAALETAAQNHKMFIFDVASNPNSTVSNQLQSVPHEQQQHQQEDVDMMATTIDVAAVVVPVDDSSTNQQQKPETNLLNLDSINLCSSNNTKRISI